MFSILLQKLALCFLKLPNHDSGKNNNKRNKNKPVN